MADSADSADTADTTATRDSTDSVAAYGEAIARGDRRAIARTITWLESARPDLASKGRAILESRIGDTGRAVRVGITGPPGVGKSTFIEVLGLHLVDQGHRVAVLAVDPTSPVTGGSILGDKTRMERLAQRDEAYIRPSPSGGSLGGVAHRTREAMLVCEAAGYDVVLVETVGIGQSEVTVASMVDFFLVLLLPGGGDELQGIKKGVMELADVLVVNKADGDQEAVAERTRAEYAGALELIRASSPSWSPRVVTASAAAGRGIETVWETVLEHREKLQASGEFQARRRHQAKAWMWSLLEDGLRNALRADPEVAARLGALEESVENLQTTPAAAAQSLLSLFLK